MRRFLVLLMMIVLPLRASAGDFMAIGMATHSPSGPSLSMPSDCDMHLAHGDLQADDAATPAAGSECGTCVLCVPVAECPALASLTADLAAGLPGAGQERFLSVPALPGLRPPSP